ncbi:efflux transporter outer membrane subunit [Lichenifustis flavocetrariae]|uniref:Efflux transporter outer membrane subunit n=1 Tax=Lichenifustis flavocetrariae TaxID=2949735 RepID=A0AA41Z3M3_9HYPH|nr:efflux transporter outer membrane subunit [Lichenifustis flavocetrariae]MCW6509730.1 efflux transporter outer membrane subunit [Lichenifustis flavocetrariae]
MLARSRLPAEVASLRGMFRLLVGAAGTLLASCSFDSTRPDVNIAVPAAFEHSGAKASAPISTDWPAQFGSTELARLGRSTADNNLDIQAAAARILQADAQAQITDAALLPTLDGSTNASRSWSPSTIRSKTGPFTTSANNSYQLGLSASYELDLWGKNRLAGLAAEHTAVATRFGRDAVVLSSVAATVNAYFTVLAAQDRLKVADDNLKSSRFILEAIKGRLSVGTVTALEVAQQESVVAQQLASFPPLQLELQQAKTQIAILAGRTPESLKIAGGTLTALKVPPLRAGVPSQLLRRRPDVAEAESTLLSADASVASAQAAFFPSISLTASGGLESLLLKTLLRPEAAFGSLASGLTQPLFDGGALQGNLALQEGRAREYLADYRKAIIQAFVDVENALIAVQQDTEHVKRLSDVVDASRRAYTITEARLKEGTIDIVTVLQTEQTLFSAEDALVVARLSQFQALASLAQALGGGWVQPASVVIPPVGGALPGAERILSGPVSAALSGPRT